MKLSAYATLAESQQRGRRASGRRQRQRVNSWSAQEDAAIVAIYPACGIEGCVNAKALRGRSPHAIQSRAGFLRVRRDLGKRRFDDRALTQALGATVKRMDIVPGARLVKRLA